MRIRISKLPDKLFTYRSVDYPSNCVWSSDVREWMEHEIIRVPEFVLYTKSLTMSKGTIIDVSSIWAQFESDTDYLMFKLKWL